MSRRSVQVWEVRRRWERSGMFHSANGLEALLKVNAFGSHSSLEEIRKRTSPGR